MPESGAKKTPALFGRDDPYISKMQRYDPERVRSLLAPKPRPYESQLGLACPNNPGMKCTR